MELQTRILVTHSLTFLPEADLIVVMKDGRMSEMGKYEDLLQNNRAFAELIRTYLQDQELSDDGT